MTTNESHSNSEPADETFVETTLKMSGKSEEEAKTMGAVDRADDQVEQLFEQKYQTTNSPAHRAVWDTDFSCDLFSAKETPLDDETKATMQRCLEVVRAKKREGTLLDDQKKISQETLEGLAEAGYWGMLVDREYGGQEAPFIHFAKFVTKMATIDPTVAGLASIHGCIGAVDPLRTFGNDSQKKEYLPKLASGERLSAFALTEPCAGSDLTALRTTATLQGDHYIVNGEKLFITNAIMNRTVGLVCLIEGKPAVLIIDLPSEENEQFQIKRYGLHALKHTHNNGLMFKDFPVPKENLLEPEKGDGLTIAYHGLNRGRVALCANAAGTMRLMLAEILPWAKYRRTYGEAIETRELVQRRVGKMAGLIVACDALSEWCGGLLDEGYRGEMECIIAKIFGSEAQKEASIELYMKTHGGRSFLHGHLFGDNVHEFLAPCIYEGEGEMLGMAYFKSLVKEHGKKFFEPVGMALQKAGMKDFKPWNPIHLWKLRSALIPYTKWMIGQTFTGWGTPSIPALPKNLAVHAKFALKQLQKSRMDVDALMRKFQLKLADRQCAMSELSWRIQLMVVMLTTSLYAGKSDDPIVQQSADVMCDELKRRIVGGLPSNSYFRKVTKLGATIANEDTSLLKDVEPNEILMQYEQPRS